MNDELRYQVWLRLLQNILKGVDHPYETNTLYKYFQPTYFREENEAVEKIELIGTGLSRLEGLPDLPHGIEWPSYEGRAMDFVAQINLSDLEAGFHPSLPERGWLYFFVGDIWDYRIVPHRVLFFDGPVTELVRKAPPDHCSPPEYVLQETMLIRFRSGFSIDPKFMDRISPWSFSSDPQYEAYEPIRDTFYSECQAEVTRIGGYPYAFQGSGQDRDALLYLNGFETLIRHGYFDSIPWFTDSSQKNEYYQKRQEAIAESGKLERMEWEVEQYNGIKDELEKETKPIEMLFGLESTMGRSWVDSGFLQFFIRQDDLANHNFDHTFCEVIST